jgi:iron complex transport system substrate-binding protein
LLPTEITGSAEINRFISERSREGEPLYTLDFDKLAKLEPDLIFTQELCDVCAVSYSEVRAAADRLPKSPQVVSIDPQTLDEALEAVQEIGDLTCRPRTASAVLRALRQRVQYINEHVDRAAIPRRVVCLEWLDPPMVAGYWVPAMVEIAGGEDMLGRAGEPSYEVDWRQVVGVSPEALILMPCGYSLDRTVREVPKLPGLLQLATVPAVLHEQVYAVDGSYFQRPGPRLVGGIEILAGIIHPEAFARIGPPGSIQSVHIRSMEQVS